MMISLVIFEYEIPFNIKKARKLQEWNEMKWQVALIVNL